MQKQTLSQEELDANLELSLKNIGEVMGERGPELFIPADILKKHLRKETEGFGLIGKKVLDTTSNWFYAKDGLQYRGVWGTLNGVFEASKTLGFIPNRAHANWYLQVGGMFIMGCQGLYILQCEERPTDGPVIDFRVKEAGGAETFERPSQILILE